MASVKGGLAAAASITMTLNSLAASTSGVGRQSAQVDNTTNQYVDALAAVTITGGSGTPSNDKAVYVYAYGTIDGTNYTEGVGTTDAAYTIDIPGSLPLLGVIPILTTGAVRTRIFDVAAAFAGYVPLKWGLVVVNNTGLTLAASGNSASYAGGTPTVA